MTLGAPLAVDPVPVLPDHVALALADGSAELRDLATGDLAWRAQLPAAASAEPAPLPGVLLHGCADGAVVAVDRETGEVLWSKVVGDSVDSLTADERSAWLVTHGKTGRTARDRGPYGARLKLRDGGRAAGGLKWKLRLGAAAQQRPLLTAEWVAFHTHDGFVRAVHRRRGTPGWRTDLPGRAPRAPVRTGGRLDFVIPLTRVLVALAPQNGAILGWTQLPDEDEAFVGGGATHDGLTLSVTSFGRVVGFAWRPDAPRSDGG